MGRRDRNCRTALADRPDELTRLQPLQIERHTHPIVPKHLDQVTPFAISLEPVASRWLTPGNRISRRHADRDQAPAGPSARGCSSRSACRSRHPRSRPSPPLETRSYPIQNLHQPRQSHRIDSNADRNLAPIGQRDLNAVVNTGGWGRRRLSDGRARSSGSYLHGHELRPTIDCELTRPEIPAPSRQQRPRNLITPCRRSALPVTPKTLLDDPSLLCIAPFPPPTFVDNREDLNL